MQPYFLPYIGYWQLLAAVDRFIVYDNIEYTKKGWINRNQFLRDGEAAYFTIPLKKGSDFSTIAERTVADDFDRTKLLNQLATAYRKAPQFPVVFPLVETIVTANLANLFEFLKHSLDVIAAFLDIRTPVIVSSTVAIDHGLKSEQKVLALCEASGASEYLNAIGGQSLYSREAFAAHGVQLQFIKSRPIEYAQLGKPFVPNLSILDVLMFNSRDAVGGMLGQYDVV